MNQFVDDFLRGQRDCQKGVPHKEGQSEDYTRGYQAEYEMGEILSHQSEVKHGTYR